MRGAGCGSSDILAATVTGDNLYARVVAQPGLERGCAALGQEVDHGVPLKVKQDGTVASAFAQREVVDAEDTRGLGHWQGEGADEAQQRVSASRHLEQPTATGASGAAEGEREREQGLTKPLGSLGGALEESSELFGKGYNRTGGCPAAETANVEE